jgi:hypothetical protein
LKPIEPILLFCTVMKQIFLNVFIINHPRILIWIKGFKVKFKIYRINCDLFDWGRAVPLWVEWLSPENLLQLAFEVKTSSSVINHYYHLCNDNYHMWYTHHRYRYFHIQTHIITHTKLLSLVQSNYHLHVPIASCIIPLSSIDPHSSSITPHPKYHENFDYHSN